MTPRQLIRLAVTLGILVLVWAAVALGRRTGRDIEERLAIPTLDTARVDSAVIAGSADTTVLARQGPDAWRVNGQPASSDLVRDLLQTLGDSGRSAELVARTTASHAQLGVDSAGGRRLRVVSQGKTVLDLVVGESPQSYGTSYLRRADDPAVYQIRSRLAELAARGPDGWRDRRIASLASDRIGRIEVQRGARSYTLRRSGTGWSFASGGAADSAAVAGYLRELADVRASGFPTRAQADSARFKPPRRSLRVTGTDGKPLMALVFDSTGAGVLVRHDSGGTVYRLDPWYAERVTPADSALRATGAGKRPGNRAGATR
jgi:hypothetical protein